jgi:hypothetical protein
MKPNSNDMEEEEDIDIAEVEAPETDAEDQEDVGKEQGKSRRKWKK